MRFSISIHQYDATGFDAAGLRYYLLMIDDDPAKARERVLGGLHRIYGASRRRRRGSGIRQGRRRRRRPARSR